MTQRIKCVIYHPQALSITELLGKPIKADGIKIGQISSVRGVAGTELIEIQATINELPQWLSLTQFREALSGNKPKPATPTTKGTLKSSNKQRVVRLMNSKRVTKLAKAGFSTDPHLPNVSPELVSAVRQAFGMKPLPGCKPLSPWGEHNGA